MRRRRGGVPGDHVAGRHGLEAAARQAAAKIVAGMGHEPDQIQNAPDTGRGLRTGTVQSSCHQQSRFLFGGQW